MCCQPPRRVNDIDYLYEQNIKRVLSAPKNLREIALTGGEPTLMGTKLIDLISLIRKTLPHTEIHILTNGRTFADYDFAKAVGAAGEGFLLMGVPLHSDYERDHDIIAGAKNAYVETMQGLYNLAMQSIPIELRIVMNKLNCSRFTQMAEFIHKNLGFVNWTAFMGMERTGYAAQKADKIWIEPKEYIPQLCTAVQFLDNFQHEVAIYNIPLCLLPNEYHRFAEKSISDWKNIFIEECKNCKLKNTCCGFFATSAEIYHGIKAY